MDDRELPLLFHTRSADFQDVTVQATRTYRLTDPTTAAARIDISIDSGTGAWRGTPLDQIAGLLTETVEPLRFLLAAPYVAFLLHPGLAVAVGLGFVASAGYAASLPLQERLVGHTEASVRGQVLGLNSTGMMAMQGIGALLAGFLAQQYSVGRDGVATAIGLMGCASLVVTAALVPGLRRTREPHPSAQVPVERRGVAAKSRGRDS